MPLFLQSNKSINSLATYTKINDPSLTWNDGIDCDSTRCMWNGCVHTLKLQQYLILAQL